MNLHDTDYNFIAVPNLYHPAQVKGSIDTAGFHVRLVALHPRASERIGVPPKIDVITFRGRTLAELKQTILKAFPQAVFSYAQAGSDPLREEFYAQQKAEARQRAAIAEQKEFESHVTAAHRDIAANLTREEQLRASYANLNAFATDPNFSSSAWVAFFKQHPNFFAWPDDSQENLATLLKYCEAKFGAVPLAGEISQGINYLLQHGHFYMKPTYKRSEQDERAAVRPFAQIDNEPPVSQKQIRQAVKALTAKFGMPLQVSADRLQAVGYSADKAETLYARLREQFSPEPAKEKSAAELKADLQAMRNASRGGARPRLENMQGY